MMTIVPCRADLSAYSSLAFAPFAPARDAPTQLSCSCHLLLQLFHAFRRHLLHQRFGVGGVAVDALGGGHQHQLFRMDEVCNHRRRFVVIHALYHLIAVAAAGG